MNGLANLSYFRNHRVIIAFYIHEYINMIRDDEKFSYLFKSEDTAESNRNAYKHIKNDIRQKYCLPPSHKLSKYEKEVTSVFNTLITSAVISRGVIKFVTIFMAS